MMTVGWGKKGRKEHVRVSKSPRRTPGSTSQRLGNEGRWCRERRQTPKKPPKKETPNGRVSSVDRYDAESWLEVSTCNYVRRSCTWCGSNVHRWMPIPLISFLSFSLSPPLSHSLHSRASGRSPRINQDRFSALPIINMSKRDAK